MTHDPISDLLTRIRNAQMRGHKICDVPASILKLRIVKLLKVEGYLKNYKLVKNTPQDVIKLALKYAEPGRPVIREMTRISKPSLRKYVKVGDIKNFRNGLGVVVISTPKGIMTDRQAFQEKVGGEMLFKIW